MHKLITDCITCARALHRSSELTYVGAKVLALTDAYKNEGREDAADGAVSYYKVFVDQSLRRNLTFMQRATIFHEANKSWIFSMYAAGIGLPTFKTAEQGLKRARDTHSKAVSGGCEE